jgi:hypothetical protein
MHGRRWRLDLVNGPQEAAASDIGRSRAKSQPSFVRSGDMWHSSCLLPESCKSLTSLRSGAFKRFPGSDGMLRSLMAA